MKTVEEWKAELRNKIREALGARQSHVVAVLRETLAAIDNAEAPPLDRTRPMADGAIAGSVEGLGAGEVSRLLLSPESVAAIVRQEIQERRDVAQEYSKLGREKEASVLIAQVAVLENLNEAQG